MGQQMDKRAEPLIGCTRKKEQESGHTQRQEEEGGGQGEQHKDQDVQ